ncbi:MAG: hypothetical protein E3J72_00840 [Planctomycetota bacterium]|nr:MAG: hypothetical protein E3J72_00840 [Planctomycetota bacterium]
METTGIIVGIVASICAIVGAAYAIYWRFIKPRKLKTRLQQVTNMIMEWFDEIDCNLDAGLNIAALNNRENKVRDYINRKLKAYWIRPTPKIIRAWNRETGMKKEVRDSKEIFQKRSLVPADGIQIDLFFNTLVGNFTRFYSKYSGKDTGCNFAEVETPIRFLKFYLEKLGYGE